MATVTEKYGAYNPVGPFFISTYGVTDSIYGVIADPQSQEFLLLEDGFFMLQEDGSKIFLG